MTTTHATSEPTQDIVLADGFEANLAHFQAFLASQDKSKATIMTYVRTVRIAARALHLGAKAADGFGNHEWPEVKDPVDWTDDDMDAFLTSAEYRRWKPGTKNLTRAALKAYWSIHRRRDRLDYVSFFKATPRRRTSDDIRSRSLPEDEYAKVLEECRAVILDDETPPAEVMRHYCLLVQAAFGLRSVAVASLTLSSIDLDLNRIVVPKDKRGGHVVPIDVPIGDEHSRFMSAREAVVAALLSEQSASSCVFAKLHDLLSRADTPLFFGTDPKGVTFGEAREPKHIGKSNAALAAQIVGHPCNSHMFRHSKIFHMLEVEGYDVHFVSKYIGHKSIQMTYDYLDYDVGAMQAHIAKVNGNAPAAAAPRVTTPPVDDRAAKMRALGEMLRDGIIDADAFAKAIAAL